MERKAKMTIALKSKEYPAFALKIHSAAATACTVMRLCACQVVLGRLRAKMFVKKRKAYPSAVAWIQIAVMT